MTTPNLLMAAGAFGAICVVAAAIVVAKGNWESVVARTQDFTRGNAFFLSEHAARMLEGADLALQRADTETRAMSWDDVASSERVWRDLSDIAENVPHLLNIWLTDGDGRLRATSLRFPAPDISTAGTDMRLVPPSPRDEVRISAPLVGRVTGERVFHASRDLADVDGATRGTAVATLSPEYLYDFWSRMPMPTGAVVSLFRSDDLVTVAQYPQTGREETVGGRNASLRGLLAAHPGRGDYLIESADGNSLRSGSYSQVADLPLYVRVSVPQSEMIRAWAEMSVIYLSFAGVSLLSLMGLVGIARRQSSMESTSRLSLQAEVDRKTNFLLDRTRHLETLVDTGRRLSGSLSTEEIVQFIVDAGRDLVGAKFGAFFYNSGQSDPSEGYDLYTLSGLTTADVAHMPRPRKTRVFEQTFEGTGAVRSFDIVTDPRYGGSAPFHGMPAGHIPVRSYLALPVVSASGEVYGGFLFGHPEPGRFTHEHEITLGGLAAHAAVALDNAKLFAESQQEIERRKETEGRQKILIREMHHRIKNNLATIKAVAGMTIRTSDTLTEFGKAFSSRLSSLAQTHTLLTDTERQSLCIRDILLSELRPFADAGRIRMEGPRTMLVADQVVPVGMAIHELTTNAVKYGALSHPDGCLLVEWSVGSEDTDGKRRVMIRWVERGGPSVTKPTRSGFGSTLLNRVLTAQLKADIESQYEPEGVTCTIAFDIETK